MTEAATENPVVQEDLEQFISTFGRLRSELQRVMVGQGELIEHVLTAFVIGEHVLLEGVPGLGKTLLVKTLSDVADISFGRIQFTPDLMPADIVGTNMLAEGDDGKRSFEFQPGPIFHNIVLADEINRATPKTQSALLQAMQERIVTVGSETHTLAPPFLVLATQNPLENEGTYPLPEAQLDRFVFKLLVEYPTFDDMEEILRRTTDKELPELDTVCHGEDLLKMRQTARKILVADAVRKQVIQLVMGTHPDNEFAADSVKRYVRCGASPRAAQAIINSAKVYALLDQRVHVAWEDVVRVARPVLRHRMLLNFEAQANGVPADTVLDELIATVA